MDFSNIEKSVNRIGSPVKQARKGKNKEIFVFNYRVCKSRLAGKTG